MAYVKVILFIEETNWSCGKQSFDHSLSICMQHSGRAVQIVSGCVPLEMKEKLFTSSDDEMLMMH